MSEKSMLEKFHGTLQCQYGPSCSSKMDWLTFVRNIILPVVLTRHGEIVCVTLERSFGHFVYMFLNCVFFIFELHVSQKKICSLYVLFSLGHLRNFFPGSNYHLWLVIRRKLFGINYNLRLFAWHVWRDKQQLTYDNSFAFITVLLSKCIYHIENLSGSKCCFTSMFHFKQPEGII